MAGNTVCLFTRQAAQLDVQVDYPMPLAKASARFAVSNHTTVQEEPSQKLNCRRSQAAFQEFLQELAGKSSAWLLQLQIFLENRQHVWCALRLLHTQQAFQSVQICPYIPALGTDERQIVLTLPFNTCHQHSIVCMLYWWTATSRSSSKPAVWQSTLLKSQT